VTTVTPKVVGPKDSEQSDFPAIEKRYDVGKTIIAMEF
jgi:hypothetical protein